MGAGECDTVETCAPTTTAASPASRIDLAGTEGSAVIEATLSSGEQLLRGKVLRFDVKADGATVFSDEAAADDSGTARLDLKRADVGALDALARADEFTASFPGDEVYCASADTATFEVVNR